jgi:hypothetical protein
LAGSTLGESVHRPSLGRRRGVVALELVTHVDHQVAPFTRSVEQPGGVVGGGLGAVEGPFAAREVVVLDVDDDQCLLVHGASCGSSDELLIVIGLNDRIEDWRERHNDGKN